MNNIFLYFSIVFLFFSCSEKQKDKPINFGNIKEKVNDEKKRQLKQQELIDILNDSLEHVVNLPLFLDSITKQNNVRLISKLEEVWNEEEKCFVYSDTKHHFKLKQETRMKNGEEYENATFIDGKLNIDFAKHTILCYKDEEFETEDFSFNFYNSLTNCRIIQIGSAQFLYADVSFMCNGIGCNAQINMIYDLKTHTPTFVENYRFPYSNYFISDFDNNDVPDLLVVTRSKNYKMKGFPLQEAGFKVLWYVYRKGKFNLKKDKKNQTLFFQFYGLTRDFDHDDVKHYSLVDQNWI